MAETMHFDDLPTRIHSGPVKFGRDWTGIFTRGDECAIKILHLRVIAETLEASPKTPINDALIAWVRSEISRYDAVFEA